MMSRCTGILGEVALADMERGRRNLILAELPENQPGAEITTTPSGA